MFYFSVENKEIERLLLHQLVSPTLIHFRNHVLESIRQQILQHQINQSCHPMIQILFPSKTIFNIITRHKLSLWSTIGRDSRTVDGPLEFSCPVSGPTGSGPWIPDERYDPKGTHGDHNYLPNGQEVLKYSSNNEIIPNIMNDLTSDISIAEHLSNEINKVCKFLTNQKP